MSWQDDIENKIFEIITGDGRSYKPKWKNAVKSIDYNASIFDFVNVTGSYVDRRKPKARRFDLEFYFDGKDAITMGNNFEISARDNRRWLVKHPFYGDINCQPLSLNQDNTLLNCSAFKVPVVETLLQGWPKSEIVITDEMLSLVESISENMASELSSTGINKAASQELISNISNDVTEKLSDDSAMSRFKKLVSESISYMDNIEFNAVEAIRGIQSVLLFPATISTTVMDRLRILNEALTSLIDNFEGTFKSKKHIESNGAVLLAGMYYAPVVNITSDYQKRKDVYDVLKFMSDAHSRYMNFIDSVLTERADSDTSYVPSFTAMNDLDKLVNLCIAKLFEVAFDAKQERTFILDKDSNPIILTHRFYGLDGEDKNLDRFIAENSIGLNEMLNIRKGRKVVYYV